jgi:hypothetical protein
MMENSRHLPPGRPIGGLFKRLTLKGVAMIGIPPDCPQAYPMEQIRRDKQWPPLLILMDVN